MDRVAYYAHRYGIPLRIARAQIGDESGGNVHARSPKGALGLTQVLPSTAAEMWGISEAEAARRLQSPDFALKTWGRYMQKAYRTFRSWRLALAAYNAGFGAVEEHGGVPPFSETQHYVRDILQKAGVLGTVASGAVDFPPQEIDPAAPASLPSKRDVALQGLHALATGHYDPVAGLRALKSIGDTHTANGGLQAPSLPMPSAGSVPKNLGRWAVLSANADRAGVHTSPAVRAFVAQIAQMYGRALTIGTGSNHSQMTVNGNVSDHWSGHAADIPATGRQLIRLGRLALIAAGMPRRQAMKVNGGLFNVNGHQIIFNTHEGGDHTNHLHVSAY